jgi:hypothetical protein
MNDQTKYDETNLDPKHFASRAFLRMLGLILAGIGLLLMLIGMGNFFWSFGSFETPRFFWCAFLGMPLLFVGLSLCMFGYLGAFARYFFREAAPVQKDTFNYLAEGTKEGVKTIATAVGEGLGAGKAVVICRTCNHRNDADAKFCKNCGTPMAP